MGIFGACWDLFVTEGVSDLKPAVLMITNNKNLGEFFFFQWGEIKILFLKLEGTFPSLPLHLQISQKALPAMQEKVCVVQASEPLAVS